MERLTLAQATERALVRLAHARPAPRRRAGRRGGRARGASGAACWRFRLRAAYVRQSDVPEVVVGGRTDLPELPRQLPHAPRRLDPAVHRRPAQARRGKRAARAGGEHEGRRSRSWRPRVRGGGGLLVAGHVAPDARRCWPRGWAPTTRTSRTHATASRSAWRRATRCWPSRWSATVRSWACSKRARTCSSRKRTCAGCSTCPPASASRPRSRWRRRPPTPPTRMRWQPPPSKRVPSARPWSRASPPRNRACAARRAPASRRRRRAGASTTRTRTA